MVITVTLVLVLAALLVTLGSATNPPRVPLWIAVLLLCLVLLLGVLPR